MWLARRKGQFLTKDEERRLGASLRKALISVNPNPSREGCPDPKTIRAIAFHKRIGTPEVFERATAHMAGCSACVRDTLGYVEEYKEFRRRRFAALALAAGLVLAVSFWSVWRVQEKPESVETPPDVRPGSPGAAVATGGGKQQDRAPEIAQYEAVTIELPSRFRGSAVPGAPIVLSRGRLLLEIRLPIGSVEGKYKLRIVNKSGKVQKAAETTASTEDHVTRLKVSLDTSSLSPGNYTLKVLEPGLDEWSDYPLKVK